MTDATVRLRMIVSWKWTRETRFVKGDWKILWKENLRDDVVEICEKETRKVSVEKLVPAGS